MSETYHPYVESDAEKSDEDTDKKDKKKRAVQSGGLLASQPAERALAERPLKLGSELLRPLSIEVAKSEADQQSKEHDADKPGERDAYELVRPGDAPAHESEMASQPAGEQNLSESDLQRLQAELAALNPEDDDEGTDKPKQAVKTNTPSAESASESSAVTPEAEPDKTEAAFQAIANAPELADLAELKLPEATEAPIAAGVQPAETVPTADHTPETVASESPDQAFNEIVDNSLGETPPGPTQYFEQAPGEPPIDAGSGDTLPPVPPTVEGGEWQQGDGEPWQQPAGGMTRPRIVDAISAVEAKHELDDLYHTSRENGLSFAVGLLGLGLVIEHIVAKRRHKKLKKQLNVQGRQLKKTNQTVQQQHYTLQAAQRKLERFGTTQTATAEQVRVAAGQGAHGAEVAAAAAAAGVVAGAAERGATKMTPAQEKVLAERLEHSRELGIAMRRNPELQKEAQKETLIREQQQREIEHREEQHHALEQSFEAASSTMQSQEHQFKRLQHEVNYEQLQSKYGDNGSSGRQGGHGAGVDASGMPMLPLPQEELPSGMASEHLLEAHGTPDKSARSLKPVAVATVLIILAAVIVMAFIR
jgi:hypothetical protein